MRLILGALWTITDKDADSLVGSIIRSYKENKGRI